MMLLTGKQTHHNDGREHCTCRAAYLVGYAYRSGSWFAMDEGELRGDLAEGDGD